MLSIPLVIGRITGGSQPECLVLKVVSLVILFCSSVSLGPSLSKCGELISKIMKYHLLVGRMILIKCIGKDSTQTFDTLTNSDPCSLKYYLLVVQIKLSL